MMTAEDSQDMKTTRRSRTGRSLLGPLAISAMALSFGSGCAEPSTEGSLASEAQALRGGADRLRHYIARQVGGLEKLTVPPDDASIPVPPEDPTRPGRYETSEAKRFLGKLLFHDPVRTARINVNASVPFDLPQGTAFGGTADASSPDLDAVVAAQKQTGSHPAQTTEQSEAARFRHDRHLELLGRQRGLSRLG